MKTIRAPMASLLLVILATGCLTVDIASRSAPGVAAGAVRVTVYRDVSSLNSGSPHGGKVSTRLIRMSTGAGDKVY